MSGSIPSTGAQSNQPNKDVQARTQNQSAEAFGFAFQQAVNEQSKRTQKRIDKSGKSQKSKLKKEKSVVEAGEGLEDDEQTESIHQAILSIQHHLETTHIKNPALAEELKELAQEKIDALKQQGFSAEDLTLPNDEIT